VAPSWSPSVRISGVHSGAHVPPERTHLVRDRECHMQPLEPDLRTEPGNHRLGIDVASPEAVELTADDPRGAVRGALAVSPGLNSRRT
jgi:hypothetical protein